MVPFRRLSQNGRRTLTEDEHLRRESDSAPFEWQQRDQYIMTFPIHPLPAMQAPFEESMLDATGETGYVPFQNPNKSVEIRQQLLCRDSEPSELSWNFTYNCHWRNVNPKGKYHPLLKTVAQIVFGVHLLHQHLEKSVADVADILLKHVNELDAFLQRANEDMESSLKDMLFRRKCLKVPMEHVNEFDRLLEDRPYRAQLLDGNITIERTIGRMSEMLNDYLADMGTFRDANRELDMYLLNIGHIWTEENEDVARIYSAMCGNTGGWAGYLQSLLGKAEKLGVVLVQVSSYCNEIEKRCGAASRRSLIASRSSSRNSSNSRDTGRGFRNFEKPLPKVPSERPPFMTSSSIGGETTPNPGTPLRRPSSTSEADQATTIPNSDDGPIDLTTSASQEMTSSVAPAPQEDDSAQAPPNQDAAGHDHRKGLASDDSDRTVRGDSHRPDHPANRDTIGPKRLFLRVGKGDHSPPLTGKDSAYSSVSGGSFASPTILHPRSASSLSSHPRAQFGLFPSSMPSTPKPMAGRHGAMSPALTLPTPSEQAPQSRPRAQTSLDYNHNPPSRSLLKKSSLSSLKRLFSKKRQGSVDTIAE
ncbi:hypothetical protein BDV95DRAFT_499064 [Massariosphaeria phaeospora]|uniref:Uncharacterized protein n=1 Tax=Massariosphaeria phaeospora TaxID=100035 RepID=A0A7C8I637_9PLEO|nr:hypothetical protein BDV95DRAFT_499064 [Massariosphaeria phaeospora]